MLAKPSSGRRDDPENRTRQPAADRYQTLSGWVNSCIKLSKNCHSRMATEGSDCNAMHRGFENRTDRFIEINDRR
jgi:hypothetical protein